MASQPPTSRDGDPLLRHLSRLAQQAIERRDLPGAEHLCATLLGRDPDHLDARRFLIARALDAGDAARAQALAEAGLERAASAELHFLRGRALDLAEDHAAARASFAGAHALDAGMFPALLWQAQQEQRLGMADASLRTAHHALLLADKAGALAQPERLPADLRQRLADAVSRIDQARAQAVDDALAPARTRHGHEALARVERAFEVSFGEDEIPWPHPLQRPTFMFFPGLDPKPWFEREDFPFLADIERHTDAIREELLGLLADEAALSPYIDMPADAPAAPVWRELNRSPRWSSYHLFRHGERIDAHARRCPRTLAALESIELMRIPEHSPEAVFSLLKAGTRIPPHTGVINGRLTVHLPLVVPPACGALKVGGEARGWQEGRCLVFDDSFVHEAWNDSAHDRAVLIFDIWDPRLSAAERDAMSATVAAIGRFNRICDGTDTTRAA